MSPRPLGNGNPRWFGALLMCGLVGFSVSSDAVGADDLNAAMDQFAGRIKQFLDSEKESMIALNQFHAPSRLAANSSSGIRKALQEALKKRGLLVKKNARYEITGEYRDLEDRASGKTMVRIFGRIVDQDSGKVVSDCEVKVDNLTTIAVLVGATMEVPPSPVREDRERSIRDGLSKPSTHVASTRISADPKSPFAVEVLVGSPGQALRPRAASVSDEDGQAYMNIRGDERYAIRLINDASFDVAVTLTIDGLSLFAFSENMNYSYVIVPQHSSGLISGWHRTNGEAEEFVVTDYARSAAGSRSLTPSDELGVITACFMAAWPANGKPPPDEMEARSALATGRGPITKANFAEVERRTGKLRASISVRYTKQTEPKDLPRP